MIAFPAPLGTCEGRFNQSQSNLFSIYARFKMIDYEVKLGRMEIL